MRKSVLGLVVVTSIPLLVVTGALVACDDSSSEGVPNVDIDSGLNLDTGITPSPASDTGTDAADPATSLSVTVIRSGTAVADARVILHDAAGAISGEQKTDAQGKVVLTTAPDALTVLVLRPAPSAGGETGGMAVTYTSVALGDNLVVDATETFGAVNAGFAVSAPLPTPTDANYFVVHAGRCTTAGQVLPVSLPLEPDCLRSPLSLLMSAHIGDSLNTGWAYKKGVVATGTGIQPETLGPWETGGQVTIKAPNIPAEINTTGELAMVSGGMVFEGEQADGSIQSGTGAQFNVAPAGFLDGLQARVESAGAIAFPLVSSIGFVRRVPANATTIDFDFTQALPRITSASLVRTTPSRPEIAWASSAPFSAADGGYAAFEWFGSQVGAQGRYTWTIVVGAGTSTVKAPALPADAKGFAPADEIPTLIGVGFVDADALTSYAQFKAVPVVAAVGRPGHLGGIQPLSPALPAEGTIKISFANDAGD